MATDIILLSLVAHSIIRCSEVAAGYTYCFSTVCVPVGVFVSLSRHELGAY